MFTVSWQGCLHTVPVLPARLQYVGRRWPTKHSFGELHYRSPINIKFIVNDYASAVQSLSVHAHGSLFWIVHTENKKCPFRSEHKKIRKQGLGGEKRKKEILK